MEMKYQIKQLIKEEVAKYIEHSNNEQVNESVLLALGGVAALGGAWAWVRSAVQKNRTDAMFNGLLETYDTKQVIKKQIPDTIKKFKLITSLNDLQTIEKQVESHLKELERIKGKVDKYVDSVIKDDAMLSDKTLALNPQREKARLKNVLSEMIENIKQSFKLEAENKRDEILA